MRLSDQTGGNTNSASLGERARLSKIRQVLSKHLEAELPIRIAWKENGTLRAEHLVPVAWPTRHVFRTTSGETIRLVDVESVG